MHDVIVAGGGPTGMVLAGELALGGVDVAIVEKRQDQALLGSRAGGLHPRTLEMFDQRGIVERFLAEGQIAQRLGFAGVMLDISDFPSRHNYTLALWQNRIEAILAGWIAELGVPVYRGREVSGLAQDEGTVTITLADGEEMSARYVVGCDGGRSTVRRAAEIAFIGSDPTTSNIIAQLSMTTEPPLGVHRSATGIYSFGRTDYKIVDGQIIYADQGPVGVMVTERTIGTEEPTLDDLKAELIAIVGTDFGAHDLLWISRFTDATRQAETYRKGRVLVAGDAAHIHPPDGGQGLQTGVQDAMNLGWKLAQVVKGISPESLLDSYHAERHPIGATVLRNTMAAVALRRDDDRTRALRETMVDLLGVPEAARHFGGTMSGLAIRYDFGEGHPLLGRRMPDIELLTALGSVRAFSLLHTARPVLLNFGQPGSIDIARWADRVDLIDAVHDGAWELPVVGVVEPPVAVLVRPDGYIVWVGDAAQTRLADTLTRWFGQPAP